MSTPIETIISETVSGPPAATGGFALRSEQQILNETGFFWREHEGVKVLVCLALEEVGFVNGFSTRLGGVSPFQNNSLNLAGFDDDTAENIAENRRRFLAVFGDEMPLATVWQVHGDAIKTVSTVFDIDTSDDRRDVLISNLDGLLVGVKTADCVPVLIADAGTGSFAAVHAGWRGTVQSIVSKTVAQLKATFGSDPNDLICVIGPAACGRNYEIGQDVIDAFGGNFDQSEKYFTPTREGHALVDLHMANHDQLTGSGVHPGNIYTAPFCTMERPDLFFSYRLEKQKYGKTGRLLSVIGRPRT